MRLVNKFIRWSAQKRTLGQRGVLEIGRYVWFVSMNGGVYSATLKFSFYTEKIYLSASSSYKKSWEDMRPW